MSSTMWLKLAFLAVVISMTAAQEVSIQEIKGTILQRIKSPNDTQEQLEAKNVIAEFLAQAAVENVTELEDSDEFVPYRRDKDHHHERTRRPHRTRRPPSDYRDQTTPVPAAPVIVNQQPAGLNPAAVVDDVQVKQQSAATQVPIITGSSGVSNPAAAPAATAAPPAAVVTVATPTTQPTTRRTRPTVDPNHVYQQNPRVLPSGGVFSTPKVNYSKETQDFVNLLMKEAHLSNTQRRGFASILRSGDPLPNNPNYTHEMLKQRFQSKRRAMCQQLGLDVPQQSAAPRRPRSLPQSGRRSLQQIMASGVYDPTPLPPSVGTSGPKKEDEIARLQHKMAYGTQKPEDDALLNKKKKQEAPRKEPQDDKESRFAELIDEIADRIDFLNSMHEMGRDKGYRSMMEYQIREKLSELEKNYPREVTDVVKHFGLEKFMSKIEMA